VGLLAPRQIPNLEDQGIPFFWIITLDLSGMGGPTRSIRYRQHSSWNHVTTQAPPLRQSRDRGYITGNHFLLEAESTTEPECGQKYYVYEKIQVTPSGKEPATFRLVALCVVSCIAVNGLPKLQSCL
jgi:hypothetical protein